MSFSCLGLVFGYLGFESFKSLKASDFLTKGVASTLDQFQQKCPYLHPVE